MAQAQSLCKKNVSKMMCIHRNSEEKGMVETMRGVKEK